MVAGHRVKRILLLTALTMASVPLCAFFSFVGYMKAFAPLAQLAAHGAWTIHLAEPIGRAVGWSEMACACMLAAGLAHPRPGRIGAALLLANQLVAAAVHAYMGETGALPQNAMIMAICALILFIQRQRQRQRQR